MNIYGEKMNASNHIYEFKGVDKDLVHDTDLEMGDFLREIIFKMIVLTAILTFLYGMTSLRPRKQ